MSQLETTLRQLRLSGLLQTLGVRLQEAAAARLGHGEFLELILQDELNVRHQRMLARRTKAADFRALKSLEDFDWQFNPSIHRKQIFESSINCGQHIRLRSGDGIDCHPARRRGNHRKFVAADLLGPGDQFRPDRCAQLRGTGGEVQGKQ